MIMCFLQDLLSAHEKFLDHLLAAKRNNGLEISACFQSIVSHINDILARGKSNYCLHMLFVNKSLQRNDLFLYGDYCSKYMNAINKV